MSARVSSPEPAHDFSRFRDVVPFRQTAASMDVARVALAIWERLSATCDLQLFLAGVAEELAPAIDLQGIGAVAFRPRRDSACSPDGTRGPAANVRRGLASFRAFVRAAVVSCR
jgi:hypothetical protein